MKYVQSTSNFTEFRINRYSIACANNNDLKSYSLFNYFLMNLGKFCTIFFLMIRRKVTIFVDVFICQGQLLYLWAEGNDPL